METRQLNLISIILMCSLTGVGQGIGFQGGIHYNHFYDYLKEQHSHVSTDYTSGIGFEAGINSSLVISPGFNLNLDLSLVQTTGDVQIISGSQGGGHRLVFHTNRYQLSLGCAPVEFKLHPTHAIEFGFRLNYLLSQKTEGAETSWIYLSPEKVTPITSQNADYLHPDWQAGLFLGWKKRKELSPTTDLLLFARYDFGLTREFNTSTKNYSMRLTLGVGLQKGKQEG